MSNAERLLELLGLLETRRDWTARQLADRLGVTTRTVRRDIDRLRELGYPVEAMAGPGGGYRLGSGGTMPPLVLDDEEAVALAVSLRIWARVGMSGFDTAGLTLLAKIDRMLPPRLRSRLEDVTVATETLRMPPAPEIDPGILAVLAHAARVQERVRFTYTPADRPAGERHVEPYRVVLGHRWYLVAFDRDRQDWRTFRLDRMKDPGSTGIRFERIDPPDAVSLVEEGLSLAPYAIRARVRLQASLESAAALIPRTVGRVEADGPDATILTIGADEPDWIARFLASLSVRFEVLDPPVVRQAVNTLGRHLVAMGTPRAAGTEADTGGVESA